MSRSDDFGAFAEQAEQLEAHIADADARGEPVPSEARAMLDSLRALARAVDELRASLAGTDDGTDGPAAEPTPE